MHRRILTVLAILVCASSAHGASRYVSERAGAPVRWESWGPRAFERAKKENRPLFVSLGYFASWECYRMHREAFLSGENAEALNAYYVPVLLDRLEYPEVAERYESAARSMGDVAGWPVNLVLNARQEPFAVAGFMSGGELNRFLVKNANVWAENKGAAAYVAPPEPRPAGAPDIDKVLDAVAKAYDPVNGGFGGVPRRPHPMTISFLLRHAARTNHEGVRGVAMDTLRRIAIAPVRDQLGGGFHRASRDAAWQEPYFEKMQADQALLAMAYLDAWQSTNDAEMAWLSRNTLDYALRDLRASNKAAFDGSQAAYNFVPVDGPELLNGNFYRWKKEEIVRLVGAEAAAKVFLIYGMKDGVANLPVTAEWRFVEESHDELAAPLAKMLDVRQKRPEPPCDFNPITGWNGLMISALSRAGAAFGEKTYVDAATAAAAAISARWNAKTKTLLRSDGVEALSEDYALFVQGLLDLFDASYDVRWLELAVTLQQRHDQLFWDPSAGAYSRGTFRETDEETPAASSVAAINLLRLAALTGNATWQTRPTTIFEAFGGRMRANGAAHTQLALAWELAQVSPRIVVVTGDARMKQTHDLLQSFALRPEPMRALIFLPEKGAARERVVRALPFTGALAPEPEKAVAYVCANGECKRGG
jgi:uncharacterized protein YyaL (SSP411 family)